MILAGLRQFFFHRTPVGGGHRLKPVALLGVFFAEHGKGSFIHQIVLQGAKHKTFQLRLRNHRHVLAEGFALIARRRAAKAVFVHLGKPSTARAADHQARKKGPRATTVPDRRIRVLYLHLPLACADGVPEIITDNSQLRDIDRDPFVLCVQP